MAIDAKADSIYPNYHVSLTDASGTVVPLILCDPNGDPNPSALVVSTFPRTALQTQQGRGKYADLQGPYFVLPQDDFSGGRAWEDYDLDDTRFYDSGSVDTTRENSVILGGMPTYVTGYRDQNKLLPPDCSTFTIVTLRENAKFMAMSFSAVALDTTDYDADKVEIYLRKYGSPTGTITVQLCPDDGGGNPNYSSPLKSKTLAGNSSDLDVLWQLLVFDWTGVQDVDHGTTYWITVSHSNGDSTNYIEILCKNEAGGKMSTAGSSWSAGYSLLYRVTDADADFKAHFYKYKGQLYYATQPDAGGAGAVYMNGYRGVADDNSGDKTLLNDSGQSFVADALIGSVVKIMAGTGFNEVQNWRTITDNSTTTITSDDWNITHVATTALATQYVVLGSNLFTALSTTGLTKPVTDVIVVNGIVYLAQGSDAAVRRHQEINVVGTWTDSYWSKAWVAANFLASTRDPVSGWLLWAARNDHALGDYLCDVYSDVAPRDYSANEAFSNIILDNTTDAWDEQVITNVTNAMVDNFATSVISNGVVTGISLNAAGTGYSQSDVLTLVQTNGAGCTASVDSVGGSGEVTGITLVAAGAGYATGSGLATTVAPAGGSNCTVDIDSISSFGTGVFCSEAITSVDMRFTNAININIKTSVAMDAGNVQFILSDQINAGNIVLTLDLPALVPHQWTFFQAHYDAVDDVVSGEAMSAIISIGLQLATDKATTDINGTITLNLRGNILAFTNRPPTEVARAGEKITNLMPYEDPKRPWAFTEAGLGPIVDDEYHPIPLDELETVESEHNGLAACVGDVYLYFSLGYGVEQYYQGNLVDMGPDRDAGMPSNRQGPISSLVSYPGRIYATVDGGTDNYSSVLCYVNAGWHEVYRAPRTGLRIRNMYIQTIPDTDVQRLWISQGSDILWVPITKNPYLNTDYRYIHEGYLETAWMYAEMKDVTKTWKSLKLFLEDATSNRVVFVDYQTDDNSTWTAIGTFDTVPVEEIDIAATPPGARRIRFRLRFYSNDVSETPRLQALAAEGITFIPVKNQISMTCLLTEGTLDIDLQGERDTTFATVEAKYDQLLAWANAGDPLTFRCQYSPVDNEVFVIDPPSFQPIENAEDEQLEQHIMNISAMAV